MKKPSTLFCRPLAEAYTFIKNSWLDGYALKSYSQEGEDMILRRLFEHKPDGFFVDIGAHHPKRFSNTYFFYKRGWRGINIDAMPGSMVPFNRLRKHDINIECGVGEHEGTLDYYIFNDRALNGFSKDLSLLRHNDNTKYKVIETRKVLVRRLADILHDHLPSGQQIDFISIDAEGLDLSVLRSNDWGRFRPEYILVEIIEQDIDGIDSTQISRFLADQGYRFFAKTLFTAFFHRQD